MSDFWDKLPTLHPLPFWKQGQRGGGRGVGRGYGQGAQQGDGQEVVWRFIPDKYDDGDGRRGDYEIEGNYASWTRRLQDSLGTSLPLPFCRKIKILLIILQLGICAAFGRLIPSTLWGRLLFSIWFFYLGFGWIGCDCVSLVHSTQLPNWFMHIMTQKIWKWTYKKRESAECHLTANFFGCKGNGKIDLVDLCLMINQ